jgi:hypothetical protein
VSGNLEVRRARGAPIRPAHEYEIDRLDFDAATRDLTPSVRLDEEETQR